jgi:hypothetical protein
MWVEGVARARAPHRYIDWGAAPGLTARWQRAEPIDILTHALSSKNGCHATTT